MDTTALLTRLGEHLARAWQTPVPPTRATRTSAPASPPAWRCVCGRRVYFRNDRCLACGRALGFDPLAGAVLALAPAEPLPGEPVRTWRDARPDHAAATYLRCANAASPAACNWLVPTSERNGAGQRPLYCLACRLNRTIPDLGRAGQADAWARIEAAKRRLVAQLLALGLPVASRLPGAGGEDPRRGLAFDFLAESPGGAEVLTGHANGLITLDLEEADDAARERLRAQLHEPYRTLLGHLRHEVGHYYWDRLIWDSPWLDDFRTLFGDERESYADALKRHYDNGAPPDWDQRFVSTYASSHPWEDWAETWAHYLHIEDTLVTALSFGLGAGDVEIDTEPFTKDVLWQPDVEGASEFLEFVNAWVELTGVLNELSRSMGVHDFYPFVLNRPVVAKLQFIHCVVREARAAQRARSAAAAPALPAAA
jgi:hypothetical protein